MPVRLDQARAAGNALFDEGLNDELEAIRAWSERTRDGSLSDLTISPRPEVWDEVAAEPDLCQRARCPAYEKCFLFKARREAAQADVIVVNHHLLLSDLAVRRVSGNWGESAVLPAYNRLVIDEGHHLEEAAASHLGATVSRRSLQRLFGRLDRRGKGLFGALMARLARSNDLLSTASFDLVLTRLAPALESARTKAATLFDLLETFLANGGEQVQRLTADFSEHPIWRSGLRLALEDTLGQIDVLADGLDLVRERLESAQRPDESVMMLINEIRAVTRRLQSAGDGLRRALDPPVDDDPSIRWIEAKGRDRAASVSTVPLNLAPILREDLFRRATTTVVTSATLANDGRFDFLTSRLGLDDPELEPRTGLYASPFRYREQAILAIARDVPPPNVDAAGHFSSLARITHDLAEASDGGMFVLFTSHRDVRAMAAELRARGAERAVARARPRRRLARFAARTVSRFGRRDPARHIVVLGRRGRARRRAARAAHRQAAIPSSDGTDHRGQLRGDRGAGRRPVRGVHASARRAAIEAGIRTTHPQRHGSRRGGHRRSACRHQGVRARADRRIAARPAPRRRVGGVAPGDSRVLYNTGRRKARRHFTRRSRRQRPPIRPEMNPSSSTSQRPGKIVCVGRNYVDHAKELGNDVPKEPLIFLKPPSSVIGTGDAIVLPPQSAQVEFEGEIGVTIGRTLRRVTSTEARGAIAGIVAVNDVTARDLQRSDSQWTRAKGFDTFCPTGELVPPPADLSSLTVVTRVNGVERQRANASDMVFPIPDVLAYVSQVMTLEPGDLVLTGTPAGVGKLSPGDEVEVEIVGHSRVTNPVKVDA